jgi:hypothetical protein
MLQYFSASLTLCIKLECLSTGYLFLFFSIGDGFLREQPRSGSHGVQRLDLRGVPETAEREAVGGDLQAGHNLAQLFVVFATDGGPR